MTSSLYAHKITKIERQVLGSFRENATHPLPARLGTLAHITIRHRMVYSEQFMSESVTSRPRLNAGEYMASARFLPK